MDVSPSGRSSSSSSAPPSSPSPPDTRLRLSPWTRRPPALELSSPRSPQQRQDVAVEVVRESNSKLGIAVHVVLEEDLLLVQGVHLGGLIDGWNQEHPDLRVGRGDWIVSVNGVGDGGGNMFAELQREGRLTIVFSLRQPNRSTRSESRPSDQQAPRPHRFSITLKKEAESLLGVQVISARQGLGIVSIGPGLVRDWNMADPRHEVRPGDRIVFVNGVRSQRMVSELTKVGTLYIVLQRGTAASEKNVLAGEVAEDLPVTTYYEGNPDFANSEVCGICLEDWREGEDAVRLPCKHLYHLECALQWLKKHSVNCPLCGWAADLDQAGIFDLDTDVGLCQDEENTASSTRIPDSPISSAIGRSTGSLVGWRPFTPCETPSSIDAVEVESEGISCSPSCGFWWRM